LHCTCHCRSAWHWAHCIGIWLLPASAQPGPECVGSAQRIDFFWGQIDIVDLSSI
jgi:hypothetical protein